MSRICFNCLIVANLAISGGIWGVFGTKAMAAEIPEQIKDTSIDQQGLQQIENIDEPMGQITNLSQLSDVSPGEWAYQALQSLVERYGCIAGYPNAMFKGNRALTRYEFAAGLNACLKQVEKLIAASSSDFANKQDLITLQKLTQDFSTELASLTGRVDKLETTTNKLESHQFSTTTKLNGEVVMALNGVATGQNSLGDKIAQNTTLGTRVRLNFDTSFTSKDLLRTRLQVVNQSSLSQTSTFTPEGDLRFNSGPFSSGSSNLGIDALLYSFPLNSKTTVFIEANAAGTDDFTNTINPYIDGDGGTGALSNFGTRNPIYYMGSNNAGLGIKHQFSDKVELSFSYLALNAADPAVGNGLFNGAYGALGQLTVKPTDKITLGLTYVNSYNKDLTAGSNRANLRSALASNLNLPTSLMPFASTDLPVSSNSYGVEASWQLSPKFVLGGWAGYTNTRVLSTVGGFPRGDLDIWNWAVTLALPDLGKKGNLGGIIVGMEPKVTGVSNSLMGTIGKDPNTSLHIEGFYQHQLTDNIGITPGIIWLTNPDHNQSNNDVVIGVIRTTFTF